PMMWWRRRTTWRCCSRSPWPVATASAAWPPSRCTTSSAAVSRVEGSRTCSPESSRAASVGAARCPSPSSTSTGSSRSTTSTATRRATSSCARWGPGCAAPRAPTTRCAATGATSSRWSCREPTRLRPWSRVGDWRGPWHSSAATERASPPPWASRHGGPVCGRRTSWPRPTTPCARTRAWATVGRRWADERDRAPGSPRRGGGLGSRPYAGLGGGGGPQRRLLLRGALAGHSGGDRRRDPSGLPRPAPALDAPGPGQLEPGREDSAVAGREAARLAEADDDRVMGLHHVVPGVGQPPAVHVDPEDVATARLVAADLRRRELHAPDVKELAQRGREGMPRFHVDDPRRVVRVERGDEAAQRVDPDAGRDRHLLAVDVDPQHRVDVEGIVGRLREVERVQAGGQLLVLGRPGRGARLQAGLRAGAGWGPRGRRRARPAAAADRERDHD